MKSNPAKQELIDFINHLTQQKVENIKKIEDLSTGVHYLLLLNLIHPGTVKLFKVNLKAVHEYQSINNLKLLAIYLSQLKASFTFQVTKIALKNYQDNLNLLKNLYKYYYEILQKINSNQNQNVKVSKSRNTEFNVKSKPKIVLKGPPKVDKLQSKKVAPPNEINKSFMKQFNESSERLRKILEVVQTKKTEKQQAAEVKLNKIKQILGLNIPSSQKKLNKKQNNLVNYSMKCSGSKSDKKQFQEFQIQPASKVTKTEIKLLANLQNQIPKKFDCDQIKQSIFKRYELRQTNYRKSIDMSRKSRLNVVNYLNFDDEDTRYNENLLSPGPQNQPNKENTSLRKPSLRQSQNSLQLSKQKINAFKNIMSSKRKTVHFSPSRRISERISQRKSEGKSSQKSLEKIHEQSNNRKSTELQNKKVEENNKIFQQSSKKVQQSSKKSIIEQQKRTINIEQSIKS